MTQNIIDFSIKYILFSRPRTQIQTSTSICRKKRVYICRCAYNLSLIICYWTHKNFTYAIIQYDVILTVYVWQLWENWKKNIYNKKSVAMKSGWTSATAFPHFIKSLSSSLTSNIYISIYTKSMCVYGWIYEARKQ